MLTAELSPNLDQMCVNIYNPTKEQRSIIKSIMLENRIDAVAYKLSRAAGAFLQCDHENYMLIEFWGKNYQEFIDYLNKEFYVWWKSK
jgi:alpha-glucosidase (family GH31 glycosyl hydrolase)